MRGWRFWFGAISSLVLVMSADAQRRGGDDLPEARLDEPSVVTMRDARPSLELASVVGLIARTEPGGSIIPPETWQRDDSVFMEWTASGSTPSISGYALGVGGGPYCAVDTEENNTILSSLPNGANTFWVRAVDAVDGCGPTATYVLYVDDAGEMNSGLVAMVGGGDTTPIPEDAWQTDDDPDFAWNPPVSASPITGYSVSFDRIPDCVVDVAEPAFASPTNLLNDGEHTFRVRAVDAAGNCGPESSYGIWVLATGLDLYLQSATPDPARAGTTLLLTVAANRTLIAPPTVTITGGGSAVSTGASGSTYSYQYSVRGDEVVADRPTGAPATIRIEGEDLAGNTESAAGTVVFDFVSPVLDGDLRAFPPVATGGDTVAVQFRASEPLQAAPRPTVTVDGTAPATFVSVSDPLDFYYTYLVTGSEGEGDTGVEVALVDIAGNTGSASTAFQIDLTPPDVQFLQPDSRIVIDVGDEVEIAWATTDAHVGTASVFLSLDGGSSFPLPLIEGIPDSGTFTWLATEPVTDTGRFRVVATDEAGLTGSDDSADDVRIRVPVADHVVARADDGTASVGEVEEISVAVVDAFGDAVAGVFNVVLTVSGAARFSSSTLTGSATGSSSISGWTLDDGSATVSVSDDVPESVRVEPSAADLPATVPHSGADVLFVDPDAGDGGTDASADADADADGDADAGADADADADADGDGDVAADADAVPDTDADVFDASDDTEDDAGADAEIPPDNSEGCGCVAAGSDPAGGPVLALSFVFGMFVFLGRRFRRPWRIRLDSPPSSAWLPRLPPVLCSRP